jgi:hypothetical protein
MAPIAQRCEDEDIRLKHNAPPGDVLALAITERSKEPDK